MHEFEIKPDGRLWRLTTDGQGEGLGFATYDQAERRARWLAIRQDVRGLGAEIRIRDAHGDLIGVWRGERYAPATVAATLSHAA